MEPTSRNCNENCPGNIDKDVVGMYAVNDPDYPQVKIGNITICRMDDTSIWIQLNDGEGGQFADGLFETAILEFWRKHF